MCYCRFVCSLDIKVVNKYSYVCCLFGLNYNNEYIFGRSVGGIKWYRIFYRCWVWYWLSVCGNKGYEFVLFSNG